MALVRHHRGHSAGNCCDLPFVVPGDLDGPRVQPGLQRLGPAPVHCLPRGHAVFVFELPPTIVLVPVLEHRPQVAAVRVLEAHELRGHRGIGENKRLGRNKLFAANGNHPALPPNYGDRERIVENSSNLYCAENTFG